MLEIFTLILAIIAIVQTRKILIQEFKISYYETKLKIKGVDISHVENITLHQIHKL